MEVIYKFDPIEDRIELETFQKASKLYHALHNIKAEVRRRWKYSDLNKKEQKLADDIYEFICDEINDLLDG